VAARSEGCREFHVSGHTVSKVGRLLEVLKSLVLSTTGGGEHRETGSQVFQNRPLGTDMKTKVSPSLTFISGPMVSKE
jgi:hypothetical protein